MDSTFCRWRANMSAHPPTLLLILAETEDGNRRPNDSSAETAGLGADLSCPPNPKMPRHRRRTADTDKIVKHRRTRNIDLGEMSPSGPLCLAGPVSVCGSELQDQASTSSKADRASPRRIIDQSPASRPKSRATVMARGAVSVVTPDFLKTTGTVLSSPILIPFFPPDPAMLQRTGGYFWSELCLAFEILNLL
jgi:hypothetical protein